MALRLTAVRTHRCIRAWSSPLSGEGSGNGSELGLGIGREHTFTTYSTSDLTALSVVLTRCHDSPVGGPSVVDLSPSRVSWYERRHAIASSHDMLTKNEKKTI